MDLVLMDLERVEFVNPTTSLFVSPLASGLSVYFGNLDWLGHRAASIYTVVTPILCGLIQNHREDGVATTGGAVAPIGAILERFAKWA